MFEKEIILKEQLASPCPSSVARPENCRLTLALWMYKRSRAKVGGVKASHLSFSHPDCVVQTAAHAAPSGSTEVVPQRYVAQRQNACREIALAAGTLLHALNDGRLTVGS
jgi:hypothetical protein